MTYDDKTKEKPLIISGVDYLLPIYKKANTYKNLVDKTIIGNQEYAKLQDIRKKAWEIIQAKTIKDLDAI